MRSLARAYLQHGRRHASGGSDPIPGVRPAEYAQLHWFGSLLIASGGSGHIAWNEFETTNTDVFGTTTGSGSPPATNASGDTGLLLMAEGVYAVIGAADWEIGAVNVAAFTSVARGDDFTEDQFSATELLAATAIAGTQLAARSVQFVAVGPAGDSALVNVNLENLDTSGWHVTNALMGCIYWPVLNPLTSIF